MDAAARTRALARIPLFARLTRTHRERVAAAMTVREFGTGDVLVRQGEAGDCVLALVEGSAEVRLRRRDGVAVLAAIGPGGLLGEMALVTGAERNADAVATSGGRALVLAAAAFHALTAEVPDLEDLLTEVVAERLGRAAQDGLGDKVLEGFRVVRPVGRGGVAVVYEAVRLADGRRVALKMMSHLYARDAAALARFDEEARLLAQFDHEGITRLHGRFPAYGTVFLVIDFVDGVSLADVLERGGALPVDEARRAFGAIVAALAHVHRGGVVHGDVKPANVLVDAGGALHLTDFGIARRVGESPEADPLGRVTGTPHYMAPEMFDGAPPSVAGDLYALGCVLVEMLTGHPPADADTFGALVRAKRDLDPAQVARRAAPDDPDVREAVAVSLAADPAARRLDMDRWAAAAGRIAADRVRKR